MRFALLATSTLVALALASYACSSSDDTKPTATDAGKASSSGKGGDDDDVASSSGASSGQSSSGSSSSSSGSSSGTSSGEGGASSSGSSGSSSGTPFDAGSSSGAPENQTTSGTKCGGTDQKETLPDNNTPASAVKLTSTTGTAQTVFCGSIEGGSDTTDFWSYTFTVPGQFSWSGGASFSAAAPTVTIITENTEYPFSDHNIPLKSGVPILFKVTSQTKVDYQISFNITATAQ